MTFSQKISKILDTNTLGISSPSKLEDFIGSGRGAITKADQTKGPGKATQKKIVEKLRIRQDWWDTGTGEIYIGSQPKNTGDVKIVPVDVWELLEDDNREFKKEIGNLWEMIRFLKGQSVKSHEG